jgi:hypothetical protein
LIVATDDPLWVHFEPLWRGLAGVKSGLLVAGGYGLFLKQYHLRSHEDLATIVGFRDWLDIAPRVTKDLDLILSLDVISSRDAQARVIEALTEQGFGIRRERWQFVKRAGENREVLLDLHARLPTEVGDPVQHLATDKLRVKHKPSLGKLGVHGRQSPEAAGSHIHPFRFELNGLSIGVPNPITWSMMKLVAMRDRWRRAQDAQRDEEYRRFEGEQAIKHAQDLCRAVAMTTAEERDRAGEIVAAVRSSPSFKDAAQICDGFMAAQGGWGSRAVSARWRRADLDLIRGVLHSWYR